jgi:hypothetical protein
MFRLHRLCWADSSQHVCCLHFSQYSPRAHPTRCRRVRSEDDPDVRPHVVEQILNEKDLALRRSSQPVIGRRSGAGSGLFRAK